MSALTEQQRALIGRSMAGKAYLDHGGSNGWKLWTVNNAKTVKGEKRGYLTAVLYLAPATSAGFKRGGRLVSVCPNSTPECRRMCLFTAGRGQTSVVQAARIWRTRWMLSDREGFSAALVWELRKLEATAKRAGMTLVVRPNGTSDLPWLGQLVARSFPDLQVYDYTKVPKPWLRERENYVITFSQSESNATEAAAVAGRGGNVAVVFNTRKGQPLPAAYLGRPVFDGDADDLRFLDPSGVVVGLRAKGRAKKGRVGGFVVDASKH